jgi:hypothetical protein
VGCGFDEEGGDALVGVGSVGECDVELAVFLDGRRELGGERDGGAGDELEKRGAGVRGNCCGAVWTHCEQGESDGCERG